jgi:Zn-dependent M28 family amino/carboxypeptidase
MDVRGADGWRTVDRRRLEADVRRLCERPRPAGSGALSDCREFVAAELASAGWHVRRDPFDGHCADGRILPGTNLVARHPRWTASSGAWLCVGAHLDSREETPGADDNASAVAALLEAARCFGAAESCEPATGIELVAFDLEEWGMLGGAEHARRWRESRADLRGMVSLEMLGYCDGRPGSQQLPPELIGRYPSVGDFIGVVGSIGSESLLSRFATGLRGVGGLPVETLLVPDRGETLTAVRLSDHSPFWDAGFAALMVTDTSFLRNPHYHRPSDVPDTLDYEFLGRVTRGVVAALRDIALHGI